MTLYYCLECSVVLDSDGTPRPEVSEVEFDALAEHNQCVGALCDDCEAVKAA